MNARVGLTIIETSSSVRLSKKKIPAMNFRDNVQFLLLSAPAVLYFFIFHYLPMFGLIMAFQEQRYDLGFLGGKFIGFKNFEFFFTTQDFWRVTSNTVGYSVTFIIMGLIAQVTLALLLFEIKKKFALKYYQTTMILPNFLSWVIVGYIAYIMLNPKMGALNQLFLLFNVKPIEWYAEPKYWPFILTFFNIWKGVGMGSIIYYASLMGINNELFEAARIDGANRWQQIMHISIPSLIPLMSILSILAFGNLFRGDFGLFYQVTRDVGILYPTTDIIDTYIYRGLKSGSLGQTAAIGMVQSLIGLVLVMGTNFVANKINPDNALF